MSVPPPSQGPSDRTYHRARDTRKSLFAALAFTAAGGYTFLRWRPFRVEILGRSMRPTLEPGDWALAVRSRAVRRGDVVVLEHPHRPGFELVKRVTGVPGDLAGDGRILGDGEFWVQGDAPDDSTDSRSFGPVGRASMRGRVRLLYHPLERARSL